MLDPTRCTIVRSPIISNGKAVWTATMTFHVKEEVDANLVNFRDFAALEALDQQVQARLQKMVWKAVYGDLMGPVTNLIAQAMQLCNPSMPQPTRNVQVMAGTLITLLKLRMGASKKDDKPLESEQHDQPN